MYEPDSFVHKISDEYLRQLAVDQSEVKVEVIIVLDYPEPKVDLGKVKKGDRIRSLPAGIEPEKNEEREETQRRENGMRTLLENMLESPPNWLPMAHAFVATVTGQQLRIIAEMPITKSIEPNRELR